MQKKLFAIIDVGSSMMTLKIAELSKQEAPNVVEMVRGNLALGIDTYNERCISQKSINHCCEILLGFAKKLDEYRIPRSDCKVVATSAIREAGNRNYVLLQIRERTGFNIEILDNSMERFYHNLALSEAVPNFEHLIEAGAIILDIGAGSIQVSVYDQGACIFSQNLMLGALRINELLESLRDRTRDYTSLLDEYVSSEINDFHVLADTGFRYPNMLVMATGSTYLKHFVDLRRSQTLIQMDDLNKMFDYTMRVSPLQLSLQFGVPADIADIMLPTAMIIKKYADYNKLNELYMPRTDLVDGLLTATAMRMCNYKPSYDHKQDTVQIARHLAARFRFDVNHAAEVERLSLKIFDVLKRRYNLSNRQRLLLQLATILHDIGKFIHMNHHSHRSFNIISYIEMIGISEEERKVVAWLARLHSTERLPDIDLMAQVPPNRHEDVLKLASILRVADALDASHRQKFSSLKPRLKGEVLQLRFASNYDITMEEAALDIKGKMFTAVYGLPIELKKLNNSDS